jgi:hypothetical protein
MAATTEVKRGYLIHEEIMEFTKGQYGGSYYGDILFSAADGKKLGRRDTVP